jgi:hypothetical protein
MDDDILVKTMKIKRPIADALCVGRAIVQVEAFAEIKPATDSPAQLSPAEHL